MKNWIFSLIFTALSLATAGAESLTVIHNFADEFTPSQKELRDIFSGRMTHLKNGKRIQVVLYLNREYDEEIYRITGYSSKYLLRQWRKLTFTGRGIMPITTKSTDQVLEIIETNENSISLIPETNER